MNPFIYDCYLGKLYRIEKRLGKMTVNMRRFIIISTLALLSFLSNLAYAIDRLEVRDLTLENGLRVLLLEDHRTPTVTLQVWYKVGSRNEKFGKTGISHLLEHMMFRGSKKYGPDAFSKIVQKNGGNDNAFTTEDYTMYFESMPSDKLDILIDLESDRMANLLVDQQLFDTERNVVLEERRLRTEDDPVADLLEQVEAVAFEAHPYHDPVIGWFSDIKQISRDDLYNHYKTYYTPNNAVLVIAGDFKTEELLPKIEKSFGKIKSGNIPPITTSIEPQQRGERRVTLRRPAELPFVTVAYHVPNLASRDSYALDVLTTILAEGDSSRLYNSLVYENQIALSVEGDYSRLSIDPNLMYFYAQVMPGESSSEVEHAIYEEIDRIKKEPIPQNELEKAKNQIESSFIFGQDSLFGRAYLLGQYEILGQLEMVKDYISGIREVKAGDVMNVARKYLSEDNRTVGILIPELPKS
jgi:zinc protease